MPDLIKKFFDTFEIKPKEKNCEYNFGFKLDICENCDRKTNIEYPEITDHILLELMELLMKQQAGEFYYDDEYLFSSKLLGSNRPACNKAKNLRELVLRTATCLGGFTPLKEEMLKQVQELFKGE